MTGGLTGAGTSAGASGYGWLGGAQRSTTSGTAGLTLMGSRVYNNQRGLFTSTDPVFGGNETSYGYPNDPVNGEDISGDFGCWGYCSRAWNWTKSHKTDISLTAASFVPGVGEVAWAYRGYRAARTLRYLKPATRFERAVYKSKHFGAASKRFANKGLNSKQRAGKWNQGRKRVSKGRHSAHRKTRVRVGWSVHTLFTRKGGGGAIFRISLFGRHWDFF